MFWLFLWGCGGRDPWLILSHDSVLSTISFVRFFISPYCLGGGPGKRLQKSVFSYVLFKFLNPFWASEIGATILMPVK